VEKGSGFFELGRRATCGRQGVRVQLPHQGSGVSRGMNRTEGREYSEKRVRFLDRDNYGVWDGVGARKNKGRTHIL